MSLNREIEPGEVDKGDISFLFSHARHKVGIEQSLINWHLILS